MTISAPVLLRPLIAESLGTGLLVATVIGSGIMAQALATVAVLGLLIALLVKA